MRLVNLANHYITKLDYFGEHVKLKFDNQNKYNTLLGGLLSILIYALTLSILVSLGQIYRNVPRTNFVTLFQEYSPVIDIHKMDIEIAFGFFLDIYGRFDDPRYFTFTTEKSIINRTEGFKKIKTNVEMEYCKYDQTRFTSDKYNYTESKKLNEVDMLYCLKNNTGTMEGAYLLDYFENFKIQVKRCKNTTWSDVVCKSDKEIDNILQGGNFQFVYTNRYLDVIDPKHPMKEYFTNYFIKVDPYSSRFVDLYFKQVNLTTDNGYLFEDFTTQTYAVFDYYREQFDTKESSEKIITLYVNSSNNLQLISRSYMKFTELAATVGGILTISTIIAQAIARFFSGIQIKLAILNTLYYFDSTQDEKMKIESTGILTTSTIDKSKITTRSDYKRQGLLNTVKQTIIDTNEIRTDFELVNYKNFKKSNYEKQLDDSSNIGT